MSEILIPENSANFQTELTEKVIHFLKLVGTRQLWIQTHDIPDPDAIASAEAFRIIARHFGVKAKIVVNGMPIRRENKALIKECKINIRLLDSLKIRKPSRSAWVYIDCLPSSGNVTLHPLAPGDLFLAIDHHGQPDGRAKSVPNGLFHVDSEEGATATMIGKVLLNLEIPYPPRLASALSYAIITDTQYFNRGKGKSDLQVYSAIFPKTNQKILSRLRNTTKSRNYFKTIRNSLENAYYYRNISWVFTGKVESGEIVAEMADFILSCERITWSLAIGYSNSRLLLSLRSSNPKARCGIVIRKIIPNSLGASGGHDQFAGGFIFLNPEDDPEVIADRIIKSFIRIQLRLRLMDDIPEGSLLTGE